MKLRLPHKFQAALLAAIASVSFTTLSTGTLGAAFFVSGHAFAEDAEEDPSATIDIGDTNLDAQAAMEEEEGTAEKEPGSAPINVAGFNGGPGNNAGLLITESVDIDETALDTVVSSEPVAATSGSADSTPSDNQGFTANPYATGSDTSNGSDDFSLTGTAPAAAYVPGQTGISAEEGDSAAGTGSGSSTNKSTTGAIGSIGGTGSGAIGGRVARPMALTAPNMLSPVSSLSVGGTSLGGDSGSASPAMLGAVTSTVSSPTAENAAGWFVHDTTTSTWTLSSNCSVSGNSYSFTEGGSVIHFNNNTGATNRGVYTFAFTVDLDKLANVTGNTILLRAGNGSSYLSGVGMTSDRKLTMTWVDNAQYSGWTFAQLGSEGLVTIVLTEGNSGGYLSAYKNDAQWTVLQSRNGSKDLKGTGDVTQFTLGSELANAITAFAVWQTSDTWDANNMLSAAQALSDLPLSEGLVWNGTSDSHTWTNNSSTPWTGGTFTEGADVTFSSAAANKEVLVQSAITAGTMKVSDAYTFKANGSGSLTAGALNLANNSAVTLWAEATGRIFSLGDVSVDGAASIMNRLNHATQNIDSIQGDSDATLTLISNHCNKTGTWNIGKTNGSAQAYSGKLVLQVQDTDGYNGRTVDFNIQDGGMFSGATLETKTGQLKSGSSADVKLMTNNINLGAIEVKFGGINDGVNDSSAASRQVKWTIKPTSGTSTLILDGTGTYRTTSAVAANVNIKKTGAGTQTFGGDMSNFNGNITVNAGTLALTSAVGSADTVSVTGGTLNLGAALTTTGGVTVGSGATLKLASSNLLTSGGDLTLAGASLNLSGMNFTTGQTVTLATSNTGNIDYSGMSVTLSPKYSNDYTLNQTGNSLTLTYNGAEPASNTLHIYLLTGQSNSLGCVKGDPASSAMLAEYAPKTTQMWDGNMSGSIDDPSVDTKNKAWQDEGKDWFLVQQQYAPTGKDVAGPSATPYANMKGNGNLTSAWGGSVVMGTEYGFSYMSEKQGWNIGDASDIAIIKVSRDGGDNDFWNPDASKSICPQMLDTIIKAVKSVDATQYTDISLDGLLFLQGETGSAAQGANAKNVLNSMITYLQNGLNAAMQAGGVLEDYAGMFTVSVDDTIILGEPAGPGRTSTKPSAQVYKQWAGEDPEQVGFVYTQDLGLYTDNLHYDGNSQITIGARYAYAMAQVQGLDTTQNGTVRVRSQAYGDSMLEESTVNLNDAAAWWKSTGDTSQFVDISSLANTVAVWDVSSANMAKFGGERISADLALGGIRIEDPYSDDENPGDHKATISINNASGTHTLSVGTDGIELQKGNLTVNTNMEATANQTWNTAAAGQQNTLNLTGTTTIADGATVTVEGASIVNISTLAGTGGLTVNGAGAVVTLTDKTAFSGATTVTSGTLKNAGTDDLDITGNLTINGNAASFAGNITADTVTLSNIASGQGSFPAYSGIITGRNSITLNNYTVANMAASLVTQSLVATGGTSTTIRNLTLTACEVTVDNGSDLTLAGHLTLGDTATYTGTLNLADGLSIDVSALNFGDMTQDVTLLSTTSGSLGSTNVNNISLDFGESPEPTSYSLVNQNNNLVLTFTPDFDGLIWDNNAKTGIWNTTDNNWHTATAVDTHVPFAAESDVKFTTSTNGQTVTLAGDTTAGNITIEQGADITIKEENHQLTGTLKGSGTYALYAGDKTLPSGLTLDSSEWTGAVKISGSIESLDLSASSKLYNEKSSIILDGWTGYFKQESQTISADVEIGAGGITLTNGWSSSIVTFAGALSGSGGIVRDNSKTQPTINLVFSGDVSRFTGAISHTRCYDGNTMNVTFRGNANEINASHLRILNPGAGILNINFEAEDTVVNSVVTRNNANYPQNRLNVNVKADTEFTNTVDVNTLTIDNDKTATLKGVSAIGSLTGAGNLVVDSSNNVVTLNGVSDDYTGAVTVNSGTLALTDSMTLGAVTVADAGILQLAGNDEMLTTTGAFTLASGSTLDLSNYTFSGTETVTLVTTSGSGSIVAPGDWSSVNLVFNGEAPENAALDVVGSNLVLHYGQEEMVWHGGAEGDWDKTSSNWTTDSGATTTQFYDGAQVKFATEGARVNIVGELAPNKVTLDSDTTFTGSGIVSVTGQLAGSGVLTIEDGVTVKAATSALSAVSGDGRLEITTPLTGSSYSFDGGTDGFSGTLAVTRENNSTHNFSVNLTNFTGTLEYGGRMTCSGEAYKNLEQITLVGDRSTNNTGVLDNNTATSFASKIVLEGDNPVDMYVSKSIDFNGAVSSVSAPMRLFNGGIVNFNAETNLATLGVNSTNTVNINAEANLGTVNMSSGGTVNIKHDSTVDTLYSGNGGMKVNVEAGNKLTLGTFNNAWGFNTFKVDGTLEADTLKLASNSTNTFTGSGTINANEVQLQNHGHYGIADGLTLNVGARGITGGYELILNHATVGVMEGVESWSTSSNNIKLNSSDGTIFKPEEGQTITLSGALQGDGALVKDGDGTLVLRGANVYSGTTTVSNGTLLVGGASSLTSTSGVTVNSGGTLQFDAALGANARSSSITVAGSSDSLPGGTLTFGGVDDNALNVTGALTLGSGSVLDVSNLNFTDETGQVILAKTTGGITPTDLSSVKIEGQGGYGYTLSLDGNNLVLDYENHIKTLVWRGRTSDIWMNENREEGTNKNWYTENNPGTNIPFSDYDRVRFASNASVQLGSDIESGRMLVDNDRSVTIDTKEHALSVDYIEGSGGSLTVKGTDDQTQATRIQGSTTLENLTLDDGTASLGGHTEVSEKLTVQNDAKVTVSGTMATKALDISGESTVNLEAGGTALTTKVAGDSTLTVGANSSLGQLTLDGGTVTNNATLTLSKTQDTMVRGDSRITGAGTTITTGIQLADNSTLAIDGGQTVSITTKNGIIGGSGKGSVLSLADVTMTGTDSWAVADTVDTVNLTSTTDSGTVFNTNGHNITVNAKLGGEGNLTKVGHGTLTLNGSNSFSGDTTVSAGVLKVNNANGLARSANVSVEHGATLWFNSDTTASLSGTTSIADGATLHLGSEKALTTTGSLTLSADSTLNLYGMPITSAKTEYVLATGSSITLADGFDMNNVIVEYGTHPAVDSTPKIEVKNIEGGQQALVLTYDIIDSNSLYWNGGTADWTASDKWHDAQTESRTTFTEFDDVFFAPTEYLEQPAATVQANVTENTHVHEMNIVAREGEGADKNTVNVVVNNGQTLTVDFLEADVNTAFIKQGAGTAIVGIDDPQFGADVSVTGGTLTAQYMDLNGNGMMKVNGDLAANGGTLNVIIGRSETPTNIEFTRDSSVSNLSSILVDENSTAVFNGEVSVPQNVTVEVRDGAELVFGGKTNMSANRWLMTGEGSVHFTGPVTLSEETNNYEKIDGKLTVTFDDLTQGDTNLTIRMQEGTDTNIGTLHLKGVQRCFYLTFQYDEQERGLLEIDTLDVADDGATHGIGSLCSRFGELQGYQQQGSISIAQLTGGGTVSLFNYAYDNANDSGRIGYDSPEVFYVGGKSVADKLFSGNIQLADGGFGVSEANKLKPKHTVLVLEDEIVASQSVIQINNADAGTGDNRNNGKYSNFGIGIDADNVKVQGIEDVALQSGNQVKIFSGSVGTETNASYGSDDTVRTLQLTGKTTDTAATTYSSSAGFDKNVDIVKQGAGVQEFKGDSSKFNGSIDAQDGLLKFLNTASLTVQDLTLAENGSATDGTLAVRSDAAGSNVGTAEVHGTLKANSGSKLASNLTLAADSVLDVRDTLETQEGESPDKTDYVGGLDMLGNSLTLHSGAYLSDADRSALLSMQWGERYELAYGLSSLTLGDTTYTAPIEFVREDYLNKNIEASKYFANLQEANYYICYSGSGSSETAPGGNVGTFYIFKAPEPTTSTLSLLALAALAARRRRKG